MRPRREHNRCRATRCTRRSHRHPDPTQRRAPRRGKSPGEVLHPRRRPGLSGRCTSGDPRRRRRWPGRGSPVQSAATPTTSPNVGADSRAAAPERHGIIAGASDTGPGRRRSLATGATSVRSLRCTDAPRRLGCGLGLGRRSRSPSPTHESPWGRAWSGRNETTTASSCAGYDGSIAHPRTPHDRRPSTCPAPSKVTPGFLDSSSSRQSPFHPSRTVSAPSEPSRSSTNTSTVAFAIACLSISTGDAIGHDCLRTMPTTSGARRSWLHSQRLRDDRNRDIPGRELAGPHRMTRPNDADEAGSARPERHVRERRLTVRGAIRLLLVTRHRGVTELLRGAAATEGSSGRRVVDTFRSRSPNRRWSVGSS